MKSYGNDADGHDHPKKKIVLRVSTGNNNGTRKQGQVRQAGRVVEQPEVSRKPIPEAENESQEDSTKTKKSSIVDLQDDFDFGKGAHVPGEDEDHSSLGKRGSVPSEFALSKRGSAFTDFSSISGNHDEYDDDDSPMMMPGSDEEEKEETFSIPSPPKSIASSSKFQDGEDDDSEAEAQAAEDKEQEKKVAVVVIEKPAQKEDKKPTIPIPSVQHIAKEESAETERKDEDEKYFEAKEEVANKIDEKQEKEQDKNFVKSPRKKSKRKKQPLCVAIYGEKAPSRHVLALEPVKKSTSSGNGKVGGLSSRTVQIRRQIYGSPKKTAPRKEKPSCGDEQLPPSTSQEEQERQEQQDEPNDAEEEEGEARNSDIKRPFSARPNMSPRQFRPMYSDLGKIMKRRPSTARPNTSPRAGVAMAYKSGKKAGKRKPKSATPKRRAQSSVVDVYKDTRRCLNTVDNIIGKTHLDQGHGNSESTTVNIELSVLEDIGELLRHTDLELRRLQRQAKDRVEADQKGLVGVAKLLHELMEEVVEALPEPADPSNPPKSVTQAQLWVQQAKAVHGIIENELCMSDPSPTLTPSIAVQALEVATGIAKSFSEACNEGLTAAERIIQTLYHSSNKK